MSTGERAIALTFDDGPHPEDTPPLLELLERHGAKRPSSWWARAPAAGPSWCGGWWTAVTRSATTPGIIPPCRCSPDATAASRSSGAPRLSRPTGRASSAPLRRTEPGLAPRRPARRPRRGLLGRDRRGLAGRPARSARRTRLSPPEAGEHRPLSRHPLHDRRGGLEDRAPMRAAVEQLAGRSRRLPLRDRPRAARRWAALSAGTGTRGRGWTGSSRCDSLPCRSCHAPSAVAHPPRRAHRSPCARRPRSPSPPRRCRAGGASSSRESGSYLWRYLPPGVSATAPAPAVLFLHGSGGVPDKYRAFLADAADRAGLIVIFPKSSTRLRLGDRAGRFHRRGEPAVGARRAGVRLPARWRSAATPRAAPGPICWPTAPAPLQRRVPMVARHYPVDAVADPAYKAPYPDVLREPRIPTTRGARTPRSRRSGRVSACLGRTRSWPGSATAPASGRSREGLPLPRRQGASAGDRRCVSASRRSSVWGTADFASRRRGRILRAARARAEWLLSPAAPAAPDGRLGPLLVLRAGQLGAAGQGRSTAALSTAAAGSSSPRRPRSNTP